MTTLTQQVAAMPLLRRMRATHLPPPEQRRAIREGAGISREDIARELRAQGIPATEAAVRWWEKPKDQGGFDPRPARAIAYRRLLEQLQAEMAKARAAQLRT